MIDIPTDLPRVTSQDLVVDNSILKSMICSTQGAMRHVLHLTTQHAKVELECGSAIHEGLARYFVTGDPTKGLARFDKVYRPWALENVPKLDKEGRPSRLLWSPVHRIFERWLRDNPLKRFPFVVDPGHVEIPVWAPFGDFVDGRLRPYDAEDERPDLLKNPTRRTPVVVMTALLDLIGKSKVAGGYWSIDHKSSSSLGPWFKDNNEDDSQFTGQLWLARQRIDVPLKGVMINGIELKSLNSSEKRCSKHGVPYVKCSLEPEHHSPGLRFPVTRSRYEIDAWETTAIGLAKKYVRLRSHVSTLDDIRDLPMEGRFARLCSRCEFRDFCRLGRTKQAATEFKKEIWNPLDHAYQRGGLRDAAA
jgi:hypothetical protein